MRLSIILMFLVVLFLLYKQIKRHNKNNRGDKQKTDLEKAMEKATILKKQIENQVKKFKHEIKNNVQQTLPEIISQSLIGSGQTIADKKTNFSEKGAPFNCKTKCLEHNGIGECEAGRCSCLLSNGTKIYLDGDCIDHAIIEAK